MHHGGGGGGGGLSHHGGSGGGHHGGHGIHIGSGKSHHPSGGHHHHGHHHPDGSAQSPSDPQYDSQYQSPMYYGRSTGRGSRSGLAAFGIGALIIFGIFLIVLISSQS